MNYVAAPEYFDLSMACASLVAAFGQNVYHVGSSLVRRDYRDVDVRCILDDEEYERLFPDLSGNPSYNGLWSVMCSSISLWLSKQSGLRVDFQIQKRTEANAAFPGKEHKRHPLGVFFDSRRQEEKGGA